MTIQHTAISMKVSCTEQTSCSSVSVASVGHYDPFSPQLSSCFAVESSDFSRPRSRRERIELLLLKDLQRACGFDLSKLVMGVVDKIDGLRHVISMRLIFADSANDSARRLDWPAQSLLPLVLAQLGCCFPTTSGSRLVFPPILYIAITTVLLVRNQLHTMRSVVWSQLLFCSSMRERLLAVWMDEASWKKETSGSSHQVNRPCDLLYTYESICCLPVLKEWAWARLTK